jgi:type IV pilus assembly protein PilC
MTKSTPKAPALLSFFHALFPFLDSAERRERMLEKRAEKEEREEKRKQERVAARKPRGALRRIGRFLPAAKAEKREKEVSAPADESDGQPLFRKPEPKSIEPKKSGWSLLKEVLTQDVSGWFRREPKTRGTIRPIKPGEQPVVRREENADLDALLGSQDESPVPESAPTGIIKKAETTGKFVRKEEDLTSSVLSEAIAPAPAKEKPLTKEEKRRLKEDEQALKEVAQRKKKEEEKVAKEQAGKIAVAEAAPKKAAPNMKFVPQRQFLADLASSLRHFGLGGERVRIIQNLATMLNAGLPLVDSLKTLELESRAKNAKALLRRLTESVENGTPFWRAMQEEHFFTPDAIALVRIGEEGGSLAENMQYLATQQEKDQALRSKITMAMIYPAIVLTLMFIIVMGLGIFVLPNLIGVLLSLNVPLPFITRMVIAFTRLFTKYGAVAVPSFIVGFIVLSILVRYTRLQAVSQWLIFKIPGIGKLLWEATIARFGVIVGGLLEAGVPLTDSIQSLVDVTTLRGYRRFYSSLLEHINVGDSFAKSFTLIHGSAKFLPLSVQQLVMTGEKTGSLSKIMLKIADIYEKKANNTAEKLPVILEPMLLLFIGALVGTIALSIIVPIYSIVGNVAK